MNPVGIRGVLFDAAGTLIELRETVGTVYSRSAAAHGVELPPWRLDDAFARIMRGSPARAFPDCAEDEIGSRERAWWRAVVRSTFLATDSTVKFDDFDALFSGLFEFYGGEEAWAVRPGVCETLAGLRSRGLRTGVVSNFDKRLPLLLQRLEIAPLLDIVTIPADCGAEKPEARIFETALERLDLEAQDVLYVGDDPVRDCAAARALDMPELDVATLESFEDLLARIDQLEAGTRAC
ncbi:MAG: HAD-IA family hydrolase [bacterium]|nr:HAD-IA family hydrolase [bacterium]